MEKIRTMYGSVPKDLINEFQKVSGNLWDHELKDWKLMSEQCEYWQLVNPASTVDDKKFQKKPGWLPLRDLNFQYAMKKCGDDVLKAMKFAKDKLFGIDGKPVYLPDELAIKANKDFNQRHTSYPKILRDLESNPQNHD